jgi:hypothetical protein
MGRMSAWTSAESPAVIIIAPDMISAACPWTGANFFVRPLALCFFEHPLGREMGRTNCEDYGLITSGSIVLKEGNERSQIGIYLLTRVNRPRGQAKRHIQHMPFPTQNIHHHNTKA